MKIAAEQLERQLAKRLQHCYLVSGDETLLVQEALDAIRAAARADGFDSRELFLQAPGFDWNELSANANAMSLFSSRRIIELRLPTGKPGREGAATIIELAAGTGQDQMLLVQTPKLDRGTANSKWVKALEAAGAVVQLWPVAVRELPGWIAARMQALGLQPDREAVRMIADRVEGNLLAAQQEIEKLRLLHNAGPIDAAAVEQAVADSSRFDVYQLVDAALLGGSARALKILDGVRAEGVDAVVVVWALGRELRSLARVALLVEAGQPLANAMQQSGVWRNRQNTVRACIGRHRADVFLRLLQAAREADASAKGQQGGDPWQRVTNILWQLSVQARAVA